MGYGDGEALIKTRVIACNNFDAANVTRTDWLVLNSGVSDHYAILRPGSFRINWITLQTYESKWTTVVELWQQYVSEMTTYTSLYASVADLMAIQAYPKLGDTSGVVQKTASFAGADEPKEMWTKDGGPKWIKWELRIEWDEETTVTFSE